MVQSRFCPEPQISSRGSLNCASSPAVVKGSSPRLLLMLKCTWSRLWSQSLSSLTRVKLGWPRVGNGGRFMSRNFTVVTECPLFSSSAVTDWKTKIETFLRTLPHLECKSMAAGIQRMYDKDAKTLHPREPNPSQQEQNAQESHLWS